MFSLKPLDSIGAEVIGLDLDREFDPETRAALYKAWLEHGVLLFRGPGSTAEQQLRLSKVFGEVELHPIVSIRTKDNPELIQLPDFEVGRTWVLDDKLIFGFIFWHQDTCYTPDICKGAILRMDLPATEGGQTGWVDTAKAYDALPEATKQRIEGREVRMGFHFDPTELRFGTKGLSIRHTRPDEAPSSYIDVQQFTPVIHPLVMTHPESGRKSLSISPANIDWVIGMERSESDALLHELVDHVLDARFTYVHDWGQGDMVLWDNRRTIHKAFGWPYGVRRTALRTTLAGGVRSGRYDEAETSSPQPEPA